MIIRIMIITTKVINDDDHNNDDKDNSCLVSYVDLVLLCWRLERSETGSKVK
jgi:hypothetical protein